MAVERERSKSKSEMAESEATKTMTKVAMPCGLGCGRIHGKNGNRAHHAQDRFLHFRVSRSPSLLPYLE
jgi:hypothetical protein